MSAFLILFSVLVIAVGVILALGVLAVVFWMRARQLAARVGELESVLRKLDAERQPPEESGAAGSIAYRE